MASQTSHGAPSTRPRQREEEMGASPKSTTFRQLGSHPSPTARPSRRYHPSSAVDPQGGGWPQKPLTARKSQPQADPGKQATLQCEEELPALWSAKLAGTLVSHTVQNAMRLASYTMQLLTGGYGTASALHIACWEGSIEAVTAISAGPTPKKENPVEARADVCAANTWGVTPLHLSAAHAALEGKQARDAESVLLLCRHHADAQARDKYGKSPLDIARMAGGDESLITLLITPRRRGSDAGPIIITPREGGRLPVLPQEVSEASTPSITTPLADPADSDDSETLFSPSMLIRRTGGKGAGRGGPRAGEASGNAGGQSPEQGGKARALPGGTPGGQGTDCRDPAGASPTATAGGRSALELAEENAALARDVARLNEVLEESELSRRHLQGLLEQSRGTLEQMQGDAELKRAGPSLQPEKASERERGFGSPQGWEEERRRLEEAQASTQQQLSEALAALGRANEELRVAREEASVATSVELTRKSEELEEQRLAQDCFHTALDGKEAELKQKDAELVALRKELSQRRLEIGQVRGLVSSQSTEILAAQGEVKSLRENLERQAQEREKSGEALSQLRGEHGEARERLEREAKRQREMESQLCEEEQQSRRLEKDAAELRGQLGEMEQWRKRAEEADKMLKPLEQRIEELRASFNAEQGLRKRYHNQMQDLKGAIRVFARIRPKIKREAEEEVAVRKQDAFSLEIAKDPRQPPKVFNFDSVFDEHNSQDDVFAECRGLVASCIDGFNVTVFAYGQTGAGKTHTMYGNEGAPGLVPRIADEIFGILGKYAHECQAKVRCSMFELYRDELVDLLLPRARAKAPPPLEIKKDSRGSVYVENAAEREATGPLELLRAISDAQERRHVASTKMNADSSRSHLIFTIVIESVNRKTKQVATGKLTLCDLAGSERLKRTEVKGDQVKEAQSINKSLSALGDVIEALTKNSKHIPYRNHKLTQLLSDSLGGNAKTLMFVNCSPTAGNADETGAALGYAARAKQIMNKVEKNQDSQEVARLKKVIQVMSQELEQARASPGAALPQLEPG